MASKPVILFVHGAWSPPKCYQPLQSRLSAAGYECLMPRLPSVGKDKKGVTWEADVKTVLDVAEPLFEQGREVVLVGHSYGGIPSAVATRDNGVEERRRRGLKGGFSQIIFVAAFAMPARGMDLLTCFGGKYTPWQIAGEPYTGNHIMGLVKEGAMASIYSGYTRAEQEAMYGNLEPHSQDAFEHKADFVASDVTIPKTYVICEKDALIPPTLQEQLVATIPGLKGIRIQEGHHPFGESHVKEVAGIILDLVEGRK